MCYKTGRVRTRDFTVITFASADPFYYLSFDVDKKEVMNDQNNYWERNIKNTFD